jgi:predicted histidine transporter YuiF (NhaC family)
LFVVVDGLDHLLGPGETTVARALPTSLFSCPIIVPHLLHIMLTIKVGEKSIGCIIKWVTYP